MFKENTRLTWEMSLGIYVETTTHIQRRWARNRTDLKSGKGDCCLGMWFPLCFLFLFLFCAFTVAGQQATQCRQFVAGSSRFVLIGTALWLGTKVKLFCYDSLGWFLFSSAKKGMVFVKKKVESVPFLPFVKTFFNTISSNCGPMQSCCQFCFCFVFIYFGSVQDF